VGFKVGYTPKNNNFTLDDDDDDHDHDDDDDQDYLFKTICLSYIIKTNLNPHFGRSTSSLI
jgi:hypothetical protein